MGSSRFLVEALVDFPDDALTCSRPLTVADIDVLMATLKSLGVGRVAWGYYGDGHGGWLTPHDPGEYDGGWSRCAETYRTLVNPLRHAVAAGHRHGLEVYAYFKPYETGASGTYPEGSPQARQFGLLDVIGGKLGWMERFVHEHPELRIQRRTDDLLPGHATATIASIRLRKRDAAPTRIVKDRLKIWASDGNYRYQPLAADFELRDAVEPAPRESRDECGRLLARAGDPIRVLTLSGLRLDRKFLLVTTDFADGAGDFVNSGLEIMSAYDERGREVPGVVANGGAFWNAALSNFRTGGLMFDYGHGAATCTLDAPNADGRHGFIAFARGRNLHLPGALCETEPAVQRWWLACLDDMIDAGVDGVDFRDESHSTHTDTPADYGYNPAVLAGIAGGAAGSDIAVVRGTAFTAFLTACKRRLAGAGKRLRYHLQLDYLRPNPPRDRLMAYPANLRFDWERWLADGLLDEAVLRMFALPLDAVFDDQHARRIIDRCRAARVPMVVNRYIDHGGAGLAAEARRIRSSEDFSGFILYETDTYITFGERPGSCAVHAEPVREAAAALAGMA